MKYSKLVKENDELRAENLSYWWSNDTLKRENKELKAKIKELETKQKEPISFNVSMNKEDIDDIVKKVTENVLGKQEHECTEICFKHHVLDPIQTDIYRSLETIL